LQLFIGKFALHRRQPAIHVEAFYANDVFKYPVCLYGFESLKRYDVIYTGYRRPFFLFRSIIVF
jgi:hypothetical protein